MRIEKHGSRRSRQALRAPLGVLLAALATGFLLRAVPAAAQDTQYWSQQYGTRSILLGGTVIGGVKDLSAVYYNPGALALVEDPSLLVGASVYQYTRIGLEDGAGRGADLSSSQIDPVPDLIAGSLDVGPFKNGKWAYSLLTRQRFNFLINSRAVAELDLFANVAGEEDFTGQFLLDQNLTELWGGLTWSAALGDRLGIGVSPYFAFRTQTWQRSRVVAGYDDGTGDVAVAVLNEEAEYRAGRLLARAGANLDLDPVRIGAVVTTPGVKVFGQGSGTRILVTSGRDGKGGSTFEADSQEDVDAEFDSPLTVGFGASLRLGPATIFGSAEWFDTVDRFEVVDLEPMLSQTTGDTLVNPFTYAADRVLNVGGGIELELSETVTAVGSLITDGTSATGGFESTLGFSDWDLKHLTAGVIAHLGDKEITLGASYAFGSRRTPRRIEFENPDEDDLLATGEDVAISYDRIRLVIGFSTGL